MTADGAPHLVVVAPYLPWPATSGGAIRVLELASGLAARGWRVSMVCITDQAGQVPEAGRHLAGRGIELLGVVRRPRRGATLGRALLTRSSFHTARLRSRAAGELVRRVAASADLVQYEMPYLQGYQATGRPGVPWVLDAQNVEHLLSERLATLRGGGGGLARVALGLYARREAVLRLREERRACEQAGLVVAVSPVDAEELRLLAPAVEVVVVPNGTGLGSPAGRPSRGDGPTRLVFVGKMSYRPNVDAATWMVREVLPRVRESLPDVELAIVGSEPGREVLALAQEPGVTVTGEVDDVRPHLEAATLSVVPLRAGSGTKLKLLEALAAGVPAVATPVGAEGIAVQDGVHLRIAASAGAFATAVVELAGDPERAAALARAGRELVEARYGWDAVVDELAARYDALLERRGSARDGEPVPHER